MWTPAPRVHAARPTASMNATHPAPSILGHTDPTRRHDAPVTSPLPFPLPRIRAASWRDAYHTASSVERATPFLGSPYPAGAVTRSRWWRAAGAETCAAAPMPQTTGDDDLTLR